MLASEHSEFECSLLKVRAEGEPSSDSNTDAAPFFSEGARHTTYSIVLLVSTGIMCNAATFFFLSWVLFLMEMSVSQAFIERTSVARDRSQKIAKNALCWVVISKSRR